MDEKLKEIEEFDKQKEKVVKFILYKKRTKQEIRNKFRQTIEENLLEDIIAYLEDSGYIDEKEYVETILHDFMHLNTLSIKEIYYKLYAKGVERDIVEEYMQEHEEELLQYEKSSAKKIKEKKERTMQAEKIKQFLAKKGYQTESIKEAWE